MGSLGARMVLFVDLFQTLAGHVSVNLRRRNIRMSQHHLQGAKVGPVLQQMGGKGMPDTMRRELSPNARLLSVSADDLPERLTGHARTSSGDEQVTAGLFLQQHWPAVFQILPHMVRRFLPYRHDAFLAPLSHARKGPKGKVQLLNLEPDQFTHSKSRSIKNLQHRAIPAAQRFGAVGLLKEPR